MYNLKVNPNLYKKYNIIAISQKKFDIKLNKYITKYYIILNATSFEFTTYSKHNFNMRLSAIIGFTRITSKGCVTAIIHKYFDYHNCNFYCISA